MNLNPDLVRNMASRPISFCGREEAEEICRTFQVPSVLSISDPRTHKPKVQGDQVLRLRFWDVDEDSEHYPGPTPEIARQIVEFMAAAPKPVLVHCEAGISRSSASTLIGYYLMCGHEKQAVQHMMDSRDGPMRAHVRPNRLILMYADAMLGSNLSRVAP